MSNIQRKQQYVMPAIADMMSGLMIIFLLLALSLMIYQQKVADDLKVKSKVIEAQNRAMKEIAEIAKDSRDNLHLALIDEFRADLKAWDISILTDNTVRFNAPEVLFSSGKAELTGTYQEIMNSFFPRYIKILYQHREDIAEIRIEGHTSSEWQLQNGTHKCIDSFMCNMDLSQKRAFETLKYGYLLLTKPASRIDQGTIVWLKSTLGAQGFSSGRPILKIDNTEDASKSRRVDFRVLTKAEARLYEILDQARSVK